MVALLSKLTSYSLMTSLEVWKLPFDFELKLSIVKTQRVYQSEALAAPSTYHRSRCFSPRVLPLRSAHVFYRLDRILQPMD